MFSRLRYYLTDYRVLAAIGALVTGAVLYFGADKLKQAGAWLALLAVLGLFIWFMVWLLRKSRARSAAKRLDTMVEQQADAAVSNASAAARSETEALRSRMLEAVKAIKTSRLGVFKGKAALYELPWYVIIGNPAAGKSTAILNSGLKFPFEDNRSNVIHGIGGTRNCDWYFTTEGIVLDTAGRYAVSVEDRLEWLTFLDLLKKHRPRAPINGIIIAASIAELSGSKPEFAIELAKNLRQRVQEITERLEVFAPVYVVFTKADLIAGFSEFFRGLDPAERENVWGATLPFDPNAEVDALSAFETRFDELSEGLKEMSLAQMAMQRGREVSPGLLTLPLEFVGIKPALRTFIATLFEENPYQFKPVFRGFYFTSALQEGLSVHHASERVGRNFSLQPTATTEREGEVGNTSHFLKGLFRKVMFADKDLVRQYSSPHQTRLRYGVFLGAVGVLALALGLWAWSYTSNRQLVENATRDLQQAQRVQEGRLDLQSRIKALLVIQQRLEQLERYRDDHPVSMGMGLYQGDRIERKLLAEYFHGMREVMLAPTTVKLEAYLADVVGHRGELTAAAPVDRDQPGTGVRYQEASPTDVNDAYNALKTYLMLGDRARVEGTHLGDQLTRYWRGWLDANRGQMSRDEMYSSAGKLMSFYVQHADAPDWPQIATKSSLVSDSREAIKQVMKGKPALERVYAQIKARASTRFPTTTVASLVNEERNKGAVAGSYAISGAFSRKAWEDYIKLAFKEAASKELSSTDWVLEQAVESDLSVSGSPEFINKELTAAYKAEYAREWQKFVQGVVVADFKTFDQAVTRMNTLGDRSHSPLRALLEAINEQTIWDNPGAANAIQGKARKGFVAWFQRVIMRRNRTGIPIQVNPETGKPMPTPIGPVGKAFEGVARLMIPNDGGPAPIDAYFDALSKVRTRLNAIKTDGETGPGARKLIQETMDNAGSELADAQRLVDEQMLTGLDESQRNMLRPLLLRPLMQTFAALVGPAEAEINRAWLAQVHDPYSKGIGRQFPFDQDSDVDAAESDIAAIFGPTGAIAEFNKQALGAMVIQRGNLLQPRRWAGMGIRLAPELVSGYGNWVSNQASAGSAGASATIFQILPSPATGALEYTIEIDGRSLRYRNTPPQWETFQYPNPQGIPGAKITAVGSDGRTVVIVDAPGSNGLSRMIGAASNERRADSSLLTWSKDGVSISVEMRVNKQAQSSSSGDWKRGLELPTTIAGATPVSPGQATPADGSAATQGEGAQ